MTGVTVAIGTIADHRETADARIARVTTDRAKRAPAIAAPAPAVTSALATTDPETTAPATTARAIQGRAIGVLTAAHAVTIGRERIVPGREIVRVTTDPVREIARGREIARAKADTENNVPPARPQAPKTTPFPTRSRRPALPVTKMSAMARPTPVGIRWAPTAR